MAALFKRQSGDNLGYSGYDGYSEDTYADYDSSNCYEAGTCTWWWSTVSHPAPSLQVKSSSANIPSQAGMAVRYTIVAILFLLIFLYFIGGYWHARRRLRKNLAPLPYHRWMVKRHLYPRPGQYYSYGPQAHGVPMYAHPHYQNNGPPQQFPQHPDYYGMQGSSHAPPPPAYHAGDAPPPVYQPPQGGSKVAADQSYAEVSRGGEGSEDVQAPGPAAGRP